MWKTCIADLCPFFNFFVGASLSDSTNPDIQPVTLFTIAIGMHYFVRDHQARKQDSPLFMPRGRMIKLLYLWKSSAPTS